MVFTNVVAGHDYGAIAVWKHAMKVILGPWTRGITSGGKMRVYFSTRKTSPYWPLQAPPVISTQPTLRLSMTSFRSRSHRERGPNSTPWLIFQGVKSRQFPHSEKPCMRIMTHCSVQTRMQESFETRSSGSSKPLPRSVTHAALNWFLNHKKHQADNSLYF